MSVCERETHTHRGKEREREREREREGGRERIKREWPEEREIFFLFFAIP